jgi:hypothetical protein
MDYTSLVQYAGSLNNLMVVNSRFAVELLPYNLLCCFDLLVLYLLFLANSKILPYSIPETVPFGPCRMAAAPFGSEAFLFLQCFLDLILRRRG